MPAKAGIQRERRESRFRGSGRPAGLSMSYDVLPGDDGWLFLVGGSNSPVQLYDRDGRLSDAVITRWRDLVLARARRCAELGIRYIHITIPEKLTIYDHKLPEPAPVDWHLSPGARLRDMLAASGSDVLLDLIAPFRRERDAQDLYFRTDSHWSPEGCFFAYLLLCERLGLTPDSTLLSRAFEEIDGKLDLGSKTNPVVVERVRFYDFALHARRVYANPIVKFLETPSLAPRVHIGSHVRYRNDAPQAAPMKILIFGDSYSSPKTDALTGMLAETVRDVEFIWSSNLDWRYIAKSKPDVVVYDLVERFMTTLATDRLDLRVKIPLQIAKAAWLQQGFGRWRRPNALTG